MTTLKQAAKLLSGGTPSKSNAAYWEGSIPWVSGKDMKQFLLEDSEDHVSEEAASDCSKIAPPGSTLLLVRGMSLHDEIRACFIERPMAFNQDVKAIVPLPGVDPAFLAYSVEGRKEELLELVDSASHGTGRILTPALEQIELYLPPINVQRNISECLYSIDRRIALNDKLNAALETTATAVFKSWFVDFDPVVAKSEGRKPFGMTDEIAALFPDRFDANGVPDGWRPSTIGQEVSVVGGSTPSTSRPEFWEGLHAWVTPKDLSTHRDPWLVDTSRKITALGVRQISSGVLPIGTVLLSSRAPIGYTVISSIPVSINQGFIAMKPTGDLSSLFTYLWTKENLEEVLTRAGGTTFAEISKASFRPIPVVVPERELLTAFEDVAGPMFDRILLNQQQNQALRNLRDAILPGLVSGELQIRDVEREIAGVAG